MSDNDFVLLGGLACWEYGSSILVRHEKGVFTHEMLKGDGSETSGLFYHGGDVGLFEYIGLVLIDLVTVDGSSTSDEFDGLRGDG